MNIAKTKLEKLTTVVELLANDFSEDERKAILNMDFNELAGLHGEGLRSRISKARVPFAPIKGGLSSA